MKKTELRKSFDLIESDFYRENSDTIIEIIESEMNFVDIKAKKDIKQIKGTEGFYIILRNKYNRSNCKYKINEFVAVYRGHASKMRERIESHLFFDPEGSDFRNCMKISIGDDSSVNINIETQRTYKDGKESKQAIPRCDWRVAYVSLNKSRQGFREMFEKAFDSKYNKPDYSKK